MTKNEKSKKNTKKKIDKKSKIEKLKKKKRNEKSKSKTKLKELKSKKAIYKKIMSVIEILRTFFEILSYFFKKIIKKKKYMNTKELL